MTHNMGEYYQRVSDYDLEYQSQTEQDVPFWCELVMRYIPQRLLELAFGSGRIGLALLHSPGNFHLEGLDIAPEMLNAFRHKLAREPEAVQQRVTLHEVDMHVFFPRELQLLFLATGFSIEAIYGGYDWKPFGKGTRQIVVGRKRDILIPPQA